MQNEIAAVIELLTKKRDDLNAAIGALSRVRVTELRRLVAAPPVSRVVKRKRKKWTPGHRAKFIASMAAKRAKANGGIAGEGPMAIPEPTIS